MKKRIFALLLTLVMTVSLAACGSSTENSNSAADQVKVMNSKSQETEDTTVSEVSENSGVEETNEGNPGSEVQNKTLVVYFTAAENTELDAVSSATPIVDGIGAVRYMADVIADRTGADMFSIQTVSKYAADFDTAADKAKAEGDEDARPELETHIDNIDQYDTIFLGYCAWWYDMPMAIYSFLDEYDLSGKTIIPFAAHEGSRFAGGIEAIKKAKPDATVREDGYSVRGNEVSADIIPDVESWLGDLGY